jgi:thymidylate synthase
VCFAGSHGAYGPRLRRWGGNTDQLDNVRLLLKQSPDTRRATIQLFDPGKDFASVSDIPCTIGYRFSLRDNRLDLVTNMRSQDAWLGLPYDLFFGTVLLELMARWVEVQVGVYRHVIDSFHLYSRDCKSAQSVNERNAGSFDAVKLFVEWNNLEETLDGVLNTGCFHSTQSGFYESYLVLKSYREWKSGREKEAELIADRIGPGFREPLHRWFTHLLQQRRSK